MNSNIYLLCCPSNNRCPVNLGICLRFANCSALTKLYYAHNHVHIQYDWNTNTIKSPITIIEHNLYIFSCSLQQTVLTRLLATKTDRDWPNIIIQAKFSVVQSINGCPPLAGLSSSLTSASRVLICKTYIPGSLPQQPIFRPHNLKEAD